ncbi:hypothetical protein [Roseivirga pacifica]|uniref:hypothetical protein n=1 Tax=Roseivirga pacifica TaxID=1267423 RepID=UPI002095820B|nr:hypothetical protein [Roseivirga pacifica]MCO6358339.1 hypothetical protein [Roseivirga pacifica]MCO6366197.1 hypothetical protein [Roseivirga pacifica]MCO6369252.1 hypothetical protein [Roseivirga pacifica]MCO6374070.1 hypothetical protein [Roseivirga pacifica]MCO6378446.1 hypothetical protein [Roseivirga pacifica]
MKSFIKLYCLVFLLLFFKVSSLKAQENLFKDALLITTEADTLYGQIKYLNWDKNPSSIQFKDINGQLEVFSPNDITSFFVEGDKYFSASIEIEVSPLSPSSELSKTPELILEEHRAFLLEIISGDKSLYKLKADDGKDNFYIKTGGKYELLKFKKYIKYIDLKPRVLENNNFLGQLNLYLFGCSDIERTLQRTKYNEKSLTRALQTYYNCMGVIHNSENRVSKTQLEFAVIAGATHTSYLFQSSVFDYLQYGKFDPSIDPTFGVSLNILFPRNLGKWSLYNDLSFTRFKTDDVYLDYTDEVQYTYYTTELAYSYLKLYNSLQFRLFIGNNRLKINGGITNGFVISETNKRFDEITFRSSFRTEEEKAISFTKKHEIGFAFGGGFEFSKYSIDLRHERSNGMTNSGAIITNLRRTYLTLGYRLGK